VGEEDGVIPVSGSGTETNSRSSGIGGNQKDFRGIPFNSAITGIPESMEIGRNFTEFRNWNQFPESVELDQSRVGLLCCMSIEFPELDGIDSGAELIPAMFNITE
jgi:hypothetical protein